MSAAILVPPASASFHLMKIREVYPGSSAAPGSDFVVLQMTSSGQNFVNGHEITLYGAAGSLSATVPMNKMVDKGANQSTILLAGSGYAAAFPSGPGADFTNADLSLSPAGGAVCFPDGIPADCVSWGSFTPPVAGLPSPSAPNASPAGISDGKALERSISAGCATLLEPGDDTDSSAADFSEVSALPRSNSTTPSEQGCPPPPRPQTKIVSGPKGKTRDRTPTFRFSSSLTGGGFRCKLDRGPFARCTSPKTYGRLGFGPHRFQVKAVKGGRADLSPAARSFRIPRLR
ncbi:MAG: hypothetical protein ACXWZM_04690 [Solirubrobacterales bacterium]